MYNTMLNCFQAEISITRLTDASNASFQSVTKIDEDLKSKATEYSQVVLTIRQRKKRETYVDHFWIEFESLEVVRLRIVPLHSLVSLCGCWRERENWTFLPTGKF